MNRERERALNQKEIIRHKKRGYYV
jgi:hypothetical protein